MDSDFIAYNFDLHQLNGMHKTLISSPRNETYGLRLILLEAIEEERQKVVKEYNERKRINK